MDINYSRDEDYALLGVDEDAQIDAVKYKYELLLRRSRHDNRIDMDSITQAYDRIRKDKDPDIFKADIDKYYTKGINKKKIINFFYQRKVLIGLLIYVLLMIGYLVYIAIVDPIKITLIPNTP